MTDDPRMPVTVTLDIEKWQYDFAIRQAAEETGEIPVTSPDDPLHIIGTAKGRNWNSPEDYLAFQLFIALVNEIPEDEWPGNLGTGAGSSADGNDLDDEIPF